MRESEPLVLSGPSGMGKTTLSLHLGQYGFRNVLKTTTRSIRPTERENVDYEFLTRNEYLRDQQAGEFFMSDYFFNNYYGIKTKAVTALSEQGIVPMVQLYSPTIVDFLKNFPNSQTFFMKPISLEFLAQRLKQREASLSDFEFRYNQGLQELHLYETKYKGSYKHELIVSSDDNQGLINQIRSIYHR
jgi:guanylate kinase